MAAWTSTALDLAAYFAAALAAAVVLTPVMKRLAWRLGAVDQPTRRKRHRQPTPLLGGLAIFVAFWGAVFILVRPLPPALVELALATLMVTCVGLWDDLSRLSVSVRLVAQAAAAAAVVATVGAATLFAEDRTAVPWVNVALTVLWIVGVTNALNLIDNMDGVAAAITAVAAISYAALLVSSADVTAAWLAMALAGAASGFLFFNFPPARLFMGDAGSFFLGLTLAVMGIAAQRQAEHPAGWVPAMLILGVPLFDTTLVTISRLRRGKNPLTTPGRDHLAHRLGRRGWSDRKIVAAFAAATAILGTCAFFAATDPATARVAGAAVLAVGAVALVWLERKDGGQGGEDPTSS